MVLANAKFKALAEAPQRGNGSRHHSDARVRPKCPSAAMTEVPQRGVTPVHGVAGPLSQRRALRYAPAERDFRDICVCYTAM